MWYANSEVIICSYKGKLTMQQAYYTKEDLEKISIKKYLGTDERIVELVDGRDSEFVLDNADVFRQGVCQLFAYALNEKYKYPVFIMTVDRCFHIFCKSKDGKYYVDVRGITSDFNRFISGTDISYTPVDISEPYSFAKEDLEGDYYDIGLQFARGIINADEERYKL